MYEEKLNFKEEIAKKKMIFLRILKTHYQILVSRKLTYQYLGIWTRSLIRTTQTNIKNGKLIFSTDMDYGKAYETGKWKDVKNNKSDRYSDKYRDVLKRRGRNAVLNWENPKKRPFMRDTILETDALLKKILTRAMRTK